MSKQSGPSTRRDLATPGQWVFLEELWAWGVAFWMDTNREIIVPDGAVVTVRHNFMWPPWVLEIGLESGRHGFAISEGWNKWQVRLERTTPSGSGATVLWVL
jgi:hypothetical protein